MGESESECDAHKCMPYPFGPVLHSSSLADLDVLTDINMGDVAVEKMHTAGSSHLQHLTTRVSKPSQEQPQHEGQQPPQQAPLQPGSCLCLLLFCLCSIALMTDQIVHSEIVHFAELAWNECRRQWLQPASPGTIQQPEKKRRRWAQQGSNDCTCSNHLLPAKCCRSVAVMPKIVGHLDLH